MLMIIIATLLVLGIAFYQATRGFFSAMIMTILTVLCVAIAFNFYDPLGDALADRLGVYAHPSALLAVFVLPLLILRELFDRFIPGNVQVEFWFDRALGGIFGLITGTILTGMLMIIIQLLPLPAKIITYQPYDSTLAIKHGGPVRWSGLFTLGIAKHLSAGPLKPIGEGISFGNSHDDLLLEAFCLRNRPRGGRTSTKTDALEIVDAHIIAIPAGRERRNLSPDERVTIRKIQQAVPLYRPLPLSLEETSILTIRVKVDESARNEKDDWWRLPATHFRLVCKNGRSYYPVGYLTHVADWQVNTAKSEDGFAKVADILVARPWSKEGGPHKLIIDWIYRISSDDKPSYVVFRRTAKASPPRWHLIEGLPIADGALSVQPVYGKVAFAPVKKPLPFTLGNVVRDDRLPKGILFRFREDSLPPFIKEIEYSRDNRLKRGIIQGTTKEFKRLHARRGIRTISYFNTPSGEAVYQVSCKVTSTNKNLERFITQMSPRLILDNRRSIRYRGVYAFYRLGGKRYFYLYYDMRKSPRDLPRDFITLLSPDGQIEVEEFGFIFLVPDTPDRSIISLNLSVPGYEPLPTEKPLSCSLKRRYRPRRHIRERG